MYNDIKGTAAHQVFVAEGAAATAKRATTSRGKSFRGLTTSHRIDAAAVEDPMLVYSSVQRVSLPALLPPAAAAAAPPPDHAPRLDAGVVALLPGAELALPDMSMRSANKEIRKECLVVAARARAFEAHHVNTVVQWSGRMRDLFAHDDAASILVANPVANFGGQICSFEINSVVSDVVEHMLKVVGYLGPESARSPIRQRRTSTLFVLRLFGRGDCSMAGETGRPCRGSRGSL